jgi:PPE-repeat protein
MSFMMFPPEVNSALMYTGAGSGPLMAAASAWDELAAELETTATSYQAVIQQLTGGPWLGPSSVAMTSATAPYIAWLQGSSLQAAQTSAQARLAAAAYEGAFDATVPPAVIAANRALLAALVATNFLGQNTPAIAATEALYMEMWFQDGLTMDTYALVSQQATALPAQTPAPTTSDGGTSADAAAAAQTTANTTSTLGTDLQALLQAYLSGTGNTVPSGGTMSPLQTAWTSVLTDVGVPTSLDSTLLSALVPTGVASAAGSILPVQGIYYATMLASMPAKMLISMANSMNAAQAMQAGQQAVLADVSHLVDGKMKALMSGISGQMRAFAQTVSAQMAGANRLGGLSIPNGWANKAPEMAVRAAPVLPENSVSPVNPSAGLPNSPFTQALMGSLSGRGMGTQAAKTAPVKVETRTPAGG